MNSKARSCNRLVTIALLLAVWMVAGCSSTKHIPDRQHLLRSNRVKLKSDVVIYNKGEIKDNLAHLVMQKPNTYVGFSLGIMPVRLWLYNFRYNKLKNLPETSLPKTVERPALVDTSFIPKSIQNMRAYLFNQGFFYAKITDTITYKHKKAYVTYNVNTGNNYLINKIHLDIDDSSIKQLVSENMLASGLKKNKAFTYVLLDDERSRLSTLIRNNGYYQFSQDNIRFEIDTMDKEFFRDVENPLENAINFISSTRTNKKPTIDIYAIIRSVEDSSNVPFTSGAVTVYPDYGGAEDRQSLRMRQYTVDSILFKYHENYVHAKVLADRIFLAPGKKYSLSDYDKTIVSLNELGIFQYIRVQTYENPKDSTLSYNIYLNKTKKHDININSDVTSGSTYQFGMSGGLSFRDKNFAKGANLLLVSLNGGIEYNYSDKVGKEFFDHFSLLTRYYGINASIDFPKFVAPISSSLFSNSSLPHTIITGGANVIERVQYFTLVNSSAYFKYNWRQSRATTWELAPAFVNIIRLPVKSDLFQERLNSNAYLRDSYKEVFIEGENITYTYNNSERKLGKNYFRLKIGLEEAGGVLGAVNSLGYALNDLFTIKYAQYGKLDFDAQRFITLPHSIVAFRLYGGVGVPYGQSDVLPYVKQFYVGGPYSLRGWRIRTLGPGSSFDSSLLTQTNTLDRTGDIKLELNSEYRFPILPLFAGTVKMNGALFADAGNIWLAKKDSAYANGEFQLSRLGHDIAMDVGAGTRFEIASFITLRLDVAMPIKKPYVSSNGGWVLNQIDFGNSTWRANNVVVNISIGYPF
ncbi:hypothetical protein CJD36_022750 [Flavipsychrobacter stenotrophus]|uniref:Bacterial surface antigen (D15) domain-containing protein n=1 Tax=Flavipsychrobacter stenotrophus TaxID=2077091 RepID=A0A2S7SQ28_9BACT|nr:BamA/TamA family outer membrane protein [Flavipsychrobacter stenotrophus]PQJ08715.1 hypothetical protein CJD36_022750 [Flavipsychrobacter stenotrophus]